MAAGSAMQLANVQTPHPRVLVLSARITGAADERIPSASALVQIHPTLLHFVANGQLMCVVKSSSEIVDFKQLKGFSIIISTMDGSIFSLELPRTRQPLRPIQIEATSPGVKKIHAVPGVQSHSYLADMDVLVSSSLLAPTEITFGVQGGAKESIELDEIEGERATAVLALSTQDGASAGSKHFVAWLLKGVRVSSPQNVVVIQGDSDGCVRFAVVDESTKRVVRSGELTRLDEPVHCILPIRFNAIDGFTSVLAIGSTGTLALVSTNDEGDSVQRGKLCVAVKTATWTSDSLQQILLFVTTELAMVRLRVPDLLSQLREGTRIRRSNGITCERLQVPQSVVCVGSTTDTAVAITSAGRVITMVGDALHPSKDHSSSSLEPNEHRLKQLLHEIGHVSAESQRLYEHSSHTGQLLRAFNASLSFLRTSESVTIARCSFRLQCIHSGWRLQSKRVQVQFSLEVQKDSPILENEVVSMWQVQIGVQRGSTTTSSFTFRLADCLSSEKSFLLDDCTLQDHGGVIRLTCELRFAPGRSPSLTVANANSDLHSFSVRVGDFSLHVIQLSKPIASYPMNPVAVREHFETKSHHDSSVALATHGHDWWPAVFDLASNRGIRLSSMHSDLSTPAPLRFVLRISSSRASSQLDEAEIVAFVSRIMRLHTEEERLAWRPACKKAGGKWWVGMKTPADNLVVLRIATLQATSECKDADDVDEGTIEVAVQSSSIADLSAMRALLVETCAATEAVGKEQTQIRWREEDVAGSSLALASLRSDLARLSELIDDAKRKTNRSQLTGIAGASAASSGSLCQDELLCLLQRTAEVETRTLGVYWKSREILNQALPL